MPARMAEAYFALLTSPSYTKAATVLGQRLRKYDSARELMLMTTVLESTQHSLGAWKVLHVPTIDNPYAKNTDTKGKNVFSKLNLFSHNITKGYNKIVFMVRISTTYGGLLICHCICGRIWIYFQWATRRVFSSATQAFA